MMEWIVTSTVLTALVIAARYALRGKISLRLQYGLWLLVLARLLLPVSFGSAALSVANVAAPVRSEAITERVVTYVGGQPSQSSISEPDPSLPEAVWEAQYAENQAAWQAEVDAARAETGRPVSVGELLLGAWIGGGVLLTAIFLWSNLRFGRALRRSRTPLTVDGVKLPVYQTEAADTPCLFGLFRPVIYVTPEAAASREMLDCAVAHEETHYRHGDHIWAVLRCAALVLHWYNPLVWWAAMLSRRDGELSCDEATVSRLGEARRAAYGRTLLDLTCKKPQQLLVTATTMTGGAGSLKERIQLLVKRPKTTLGIFLLVAALTAVAVGCTFTGPTEESSIPSTADVDKVVDEAAAEPEQAADPVSDGTAELTEAMEQLSSGVPVRLSMLVDIGVIADFDGSACDNATYFANNLVEYTYEPEDLDVTGSVRINLIPTAEGADWSLTYYDDGDYVTLNLGEDSWNFRAESEDDVPVGDIARWWYDEAEYQGFGGGYGNQDDIRVGDQGQDYLQAAGAFCSILEGRHQDVSEGSKYKYDFVQCYVEAADETTEAMRERGEIGENTWAFWLTTVFVPENEDALNWSMAGNTGEYTGSDPTVPEGAWEYYRCGYITLEDDGWHGEIVGTGW